MTGGSIQQLTARPWLPPLSIASIIGVVLFLLYIGSAVISFLSDMPVPLLRGSDSQGDDAEYCRTTWRKGPHDRRRRLYVQAHGDISQQITTLAMAQDASNRLDTSLVIVWSDKGLKDDSWDDAFQTSKDMTSGCFPGDTRSVRSAKCYVQDVRSWEDWEEFVSFVHREGGSEDLCVSSSVSLTDMPVSSRKKTDTTPWKYYDNLRPSESIAHALSGFKKENEWDADWGYWVGIDVAGQHGVRPEDVVAAVMYQFENVQRGEEDKDGLRVLLMVEDKDVEAMLYDKLIFEYPHLASSKRLVTSDAIFDESLKSKSAGKVWLESLCNVVVTMGGFETCSAATHLHGHSLDYCIDVNQ